MINIFMIHILILPASYYILPTDIQLLRNIIIQLLCDIIMIHANALLVNYNNNIQHYHIRRRYGEQLSVTKFLFINKCNYNNCDRIKSDSVLSLRIDKQIICLSIYYYSTIIRSTITLFYFYLDYR